MTDDVMGEFEEKARELVNEIYSYVDRDGSLIGEEECVIKTSSVLAESFAKGRASKIKLPSEDESALAARMNATNGEPCLLCFLKGVEWLQEQIKSLNEVGNVH